MGQTRYSVIVADVIGDLGHRACGEEDSCGLERRVKKFKKILVDISEEHCESHLYTLKYHQFLDVV